MPDRTIGNLKSTWTVIAFFRNHAVMKNATLHYYAFHVRFCKALK
jgi:hypothetical protein